MYFVQMVPDRRNVFITYVRHKQQEFSSSAIKRLDAYDIIIDVRDAKLLIVVLWCRNRDNLAK
jgi:hypothetical protein